MWLEKALIHPALSSRSQYAQDPDEQCALDLVVTVAIAQFSFEDI